MAVIYETSDVALLSSLSIEINQPLAKVIPIALPGLIAVTRLVFAQCSRGLRQF